MKSLKLNFILLLLAFIESAFFFIFFANSAQATHQWECDKLYYTSNDPISPTCSNFDHSFTFCSVDGSEAQACFNDGTSDLKINCFQFSDLCGMTVGLASSKDTVSPGESFNLSWVTNHNPTTCNAHGAWSGFKSSLGGTEPITAPSSPGTYNYFLDCSNILSSASDSFTLTVSSPVSTPTPTPTTAPAPALSVTPTVGHFGTVALGSSSLIDFTVKNVGGGTLDGAFTTGLNPPFSCATSPCGYSLPAGASQTFTLKFAPTVSGAFSTTVTLTSSGVGVATISLDGTGGAVVGPALSVTPTVGHFGTVALGSSGLIDFTVKNVGGGTLNGAFITPLDGPFFCATLPCGYSLPTGTSQTFTLKFAPTLSGFFSLTVTLTSSGVPVATISLSGTGSSVAPDPALSVTPTVGNFGTVAIGSSSLINFTVKNVGGGTLNGAFITPLDGPFFCATLPCGYSLPTGTSQTFTLKFAPTLSGFFSLTVTLTSSGVPVATISLSGTGSSVASTPTPTPTTAPGTSTISGNVFIDDGAGSGRADNCAQDGAETGYPNNTGGTGVQILETGATTITGALGDYFFNNLLSGIYTVQLTVPSLYEMSSCNTFQKTASVPNPPSPQVVNFFIVPITAPTSTPGPTSTPPPTPTPTPAGPKACFTFIVNGMSVNFTDCSTPGASPIKQWLWDFNNAEPIELVHTDVLPPPKPFFTFNYSDFGQVCGSKTYTAVLTVKNALGTSTDSEPVTVNGPKPKDLEGVLQCSIDSVDGNCKCTKVDTAIGPISVQGTSFVTRIMSLLLGISGGIAVLLIILSGYTLMTSRDKPEAIQDSRQRLLGAIVGLLFIALALVVLQVIGVDILHIPGFKP